jgi:hypothetical protein
MIYRLLDKMDAFMFKDEFNYTDRWETLQMWIIIGAVALFLGYAIYRGLKDEHKQG